VGMTDHCGERRRSGTARRPQDGFEASYRAGKEKIS
jgi:hypothetical protein